MNTPPKVLELVDLFRRNTDAYHAPHYNEAMVRQEFINPLFKCLGWDMDNEQGYAEAYKDVIHEAAIKIGGATKAPDYCFRIGGSAKFFLEAKRPSVSIKDDPAPAYQLRRYAWTGKLPLSILTDFEEFAVYDCRIKPAHTDKAGVARVLYLRYDDYPDRWDDIAGKFSREAILKGSFDKFAESNKAKRGTAAVDTAFLQEIESWREMLARNLALRNPQLSQRELNYAVQVTIDRIIFLRMCEDRGIEPYGQLQKLLQGPDIYPNLFALYRKADQRYNSGLFHFEAEKGRSEAPDTLTPSLLLEDKPLKDILHGLYYPECPYEFSVLSGEILGQVYEQFLGKVIRLTAGHRAVVEDKPEVRKAGGVYYTPTYIVKQTVGKLLGEPGASAARLTPKQAAKLRILDPACGSGSFLLGAYQLLLDWHRDYYVADGPKKHTKELYQGAGGVWRLTTAEKKRILLANIYGVDIDPQAAEVTKLSLLLKVLEGESEQTLQSQLQMFHERALPDLSSNIPCGNSLIGPDFYDGQQMTMFDEEERYRINVFDWEAAFPWLRESGGFDAVIGNPPYLFITEVPENQRSYFDSRYHGVDYRFDLYGAFIERAALAWLRSDGLFGFIIPHTLLSNDSFRALRSLLAKHVSVFQVVDLGPGVFQDARNETMLLFFEAGGAKSDAVVEVVRTNPKIFPQTIQRFTPRQREWIHPSGEPWLVHVSSETADLLSRMRQAEHTLGQLCTINQGLRTGNNDKYLSTTKQGGKWRPAAGGKHIARYAPILPEVFVFYEPSLLDAPRKPEIFLSKEKMVVQEVRNIALPRRIVATLDQNQVFCLQSTNVINRRLDCPYDICYLLGLLNSNSVNAFFRFSFPGNNHIPSNQLAKIPVPKSEKQNHDRLVLLVGQMLSLHKQLAAAKTPQEHTVLQRQIDAMDRQIDQLVYELYGLTDAEIEIVEMANS
ncbi:MAG TPA: N-6 DNA methylase [Gemmataceae bacterium]|nr:N-6 DNA methylase [Gemmataceae bacterium]